MYASTKYLQYELLKKGHCKKTKCLFSMKYGMLEKNLRVQKVFKLQAKLINFIYFQSINVYVHLASEI